MKYKTARPHRYVPFYSNLSKHVMYETSRSTVNSYSRHCHCPYSYLSLVISLVPDHEMSTCTRPPSSHRSRCCKCLCRWQATSSCCCWQASPSFHSSFPQIRTCIRSPHHATHCTTLTAYKGNTLIQRHGLSRQHEHGLEPPTRTGLLKHSFHGGSISTRCHGFSKNPRPKYFRRISRWRYIHRLLTVSR